LTTRPEVRILRGAALVNGAVPAGLLLWDAWHHDLGVNPIEFVLRTTGLLGLTFLMLTLAVTPLRRLFGWTALIKVRRTLGLYAFFYLCCHVLTYVWLDQWFDLRALAQDVLGRPFITVGLITFIFMVPLAITSTDKAVRRLGGKKWAALHQRVYWLAGAGVLHYWLAVKADHRRPLVFAVILALLLGARTLGRRRPADALSGPAR
jgi:sulfoxide reductase heme-binding subunit YedZ